MKGVYRICLIMTSALFIGKTGFPQANMDHSKKSCKMENIAIQNKETIRLLYDSILNQQRFEKLEQLIAKEYTNSQGAKGPEGFKKSILELRRSFPDARWKIEEIIAEGNKVFVKQKFTGTQKNPFQGISPTNNSVSVDGMAIYEFLNRKIIYSQVQTDRIGFLQQLNVLPVDLSKLIQSDDNANAICFLDRFIVPKASIEEFSKQMNYNRDFVKKLPGYIRGEAYDRVDTAGNLTIVTIAVWEDQDKLDNAKIAVQAEFKRINFNPGDFYQRLDIKLERGQYRLLHE